MSSKVLLALSLAANVILVALVLRPASTPEPAGSAASTPGGTRAHAEPPPSGPEGIVTNTLVRRITWEQVESPDYRQYIENLRSIGCPEETIRDIILADVNKLYDSKRKQVRGTSRKFEYWKAGNPMAGMMGDPELLQSMRALEDEKNQVLRNLGIEPDPANPLMQIAGGNPMDVMFEFLPESKRADVGRLMTEYQSRMMESAKDGPLDGEAVMKNQRAMEDALRGVLTPEEFQDYQLRFSMTANTLRQQILGFDPSEQEFLEIFKLKEAFDQEYSPFGLSNPTEAESQKRMEAMSQLNERIRESLGTERYAEYERAQDYSYQQLYQLAKKSDLPPTVANEVYDMKRASEREANEIRRDGSLSHEQRTAALHAIRAETERAMQQSLGNEAWDQYNRPNNTWWLRNIAPTPSDAGGPTIAPTVIHDTIIVSPTP